MRELLLAVAPARVRDAGRRCSPPSASWRRATRTRACAGRGDRRVVGPRRLRARGPVGRRLPADRARRPRRGRRPAGGDAVGRRAQAARARPAVRLRRAESCCSTSPTTSSTCRPSARSRRRSARRKKTVLLISHDRELLTAACDTIVTLEGNGAWVHGESYATYAAGARAPPGADGRPRCSAGRTRSGACASSCGSSRSARKYSPRLGQEGERDGDALEALRRRGPAAGARRRPARSRCACAAATRARRVVALKRRRRSTGSCGRSTRRSTSASASAVVGPNGSGKTHLIRLLAGEAVAHDGEVVHRPPRLARACSRSSTPAPDFARPHAARHRDRAHEGDRAGHARRSPATGSPEAAQPHLRDAVGRPEGAAGDPLPRARGPQPAAARRADGQPRHRLLGGARVARWTASRGRSSRSRTTARSCALDRFFLLGHDGGVALLADPARRWSRWGPDFDPRF